MADEAQIATLQANYANIDKGLTSLLAKMDAASVLNNAQNLQIMTQIAALDVKQQYASQNQEKYQDSCDAERKELRGILSEHSNILSGIKARAGLIGAFMGAVSGIFAAIIAALIGAPHK